MTYLGIFIFHAMMIKLYVGEWIISFFNTISDFLYWIGLDAISLTAYNFGYSIVNNDPLITAGVFTVVTAMFINPQTVIAMDRYSETL